MFERVHVIGTGRAGSAIRGRLLERGLAVTDGRVADPAAELVLLCVPDQVIGEVAAGVGIGPWVAHVSGATHARRAGAARAALQHPPAADADPRARAGAARRRLGRDQRRDR